MTVDQANEAAVGALVDAPRLRGRVALVTGAAQGLGQAMAELFATHGAAVVVADRRDGQHVAGRIGDGGGRARYLPVDVTDHRAVEAAIAETTGTFGGLHILCNNAGMSPEQDGDPVATPDDTWREVMDTNVRGVFLCCKYGLPAMLRSGGGSIVNIASFVAHLGSATPQVAYTTSKGAVVAMTREIAVTYARSGIRANALCPGPVMTPLLAKFLSDDEQRHRRLVHVPMGRFGEPMEIAKAALFLASDDSSFVTGQSLLVDGGITAAYTTPEGVAGGNGADPVWGTGRG